MDFPIYLLQEPLPKNVNKHGVFVSGGIVSLSLAGKKYFIKITTYLHNSRYYYGVSVNVNTSGLGLPARYYGTCYATENAAVLSGIEDVLDWSGISMPFSINDTEKKERKAFITALLNKKQQYA